MHRYKLFQLLSAAIALVAGFSSPCAAQMRMEGEAIVGQPFGVGRISVQAPLGMRLGEPGTETVALRERNGRAFYPAYGTAPVRQLLRELVSAPPRRFEVYFLFQGTEPLDVTLFAPGALPRQIVPRQDAAGYERLLGAWWREYSGARKSNGTGDFPPTVNTYLTSMLGRRLRFDPADRRPASEQLTETESVLGLLLGTESMRLALQNAMWLEGVGAAERADQPLPAAVAQRQLDIPDPPADVPVEPLAMRVPAECFYMRFGSFSNFQWYRDRMADWGGDLRNMLSQRGVSYDLNEKVQRQLAVKESALSKLLGNQVIADAALIGLDTFVREGGAIGILFQARNSTALGAGLTGQRLEAKSQNPNAKEEKIELAGKSVSFLSTPDGAVRSYYVSDGDFHLMTTSRALVSRFLETANDNSSLGKSKEFRYARTIMPLARNDAAFIYLSDALFRNLASPHYRVEMQRRLRSETEMELAQFARLAAQAERQPHQTMAELAAAGFLPSAMIGRADGSRLMFDDGRVYDSVRGERGLFVPIPDVPVTAATAGEVRDYQQFAEFFQSQWGQMDPVMIAVGRSPSQQSGLEHVTLDIKASPLSPKHFDMLSRWLGAPTNQRRVKVPGDLVSFQAMLNDGQAGDYYLFGAVRDAPPQAGPDNPLVGLLMNLQGIQGIQAYVGAWPQPGILRMLGLGAASPPDPAGFSRLRPIGLWQRAVNQFTLLSFQRDVLLDVTPQLRFEKASEPAQAWLKAEDLAQSKVAEIINSFGYQHERRVSLGNTGFMHSLSEQLHVPAQQALPTAESILGANIACPLGGKYELVGAAEGLQSWVSSAVRSPQQPQGARGVPRGYQFPALTWVRGLDVQVRMERNLLSAHAELEMPAQATSGLQLPTFSLPGKAPAPTSEALPPPK